LTGGDLSGLDPKWFRINENGEPAFTDLEAIKQTIQEVKKTLENKSQVLVGHNLFNDLIFIYRTFVGTLPDEVTEFNQRIHQLFPQIFDTKYMATAAGSSMQSNSSLRDICDEVKTLTKPFIVLAERHMAYAARHRDHEAGYDSEPQEFIYIDMANNFSGWMTAQVFVKLSAKLAAEQRGTDSSEEELETKSKASYDLPSTQGATQKYHLSKGVRQALRMVSNRSSSAIPNGGYIPNTM
jgi:poly(A)-specific ribonuclease